MKINFFLQSRTLSNGKNRLMFRVSNTRKHRQDFTTDLALYKAHFNKKDLRVSEMHPQYLDVNRRLKVWSDRKRYCQDKWDAKAYTVFQVQSYMQGKTDNTTLDSFLDTTYKDMLDTDTSYRSYRDGINAIKRHMNIKGDLYFSDVTTEFYEKLILKLKKTKKKNGTSYSKYTLVKYVKDLSILMNMAKDKNIIFEVPQVPKGYTRGTRLEYQAIKEGLSKKYEPPTTEKFEEYIKSIKTVKDWQAGAFWLLMFMTRGLYAGDLVALSEITINKPNYSRRIRGTLFALHYRQKTLWSNRRAMLIHMDHTIIDLIGMIKRSLVHTHLHRHYGDVIAKGDDLIKIFDYDHSQNSEFHRRLWEGWNKKTSKLGFRLKDARKSYLRYGKRLKLSDETRKMLVGQLNDKLLGEFYDFDEDEVVQSDVQVAHRKILKAFNASKLYRQLVARLDEIKAPKWIKKQLGLVKDIRENTHWSKAISKGKLIQKGHFILYDFAPNPKRDIVDGVVNAMKAFQYEEVSKETYEWFLDTLDTKEDRERKQREYIKYNDEIRKYLFGNSKEAKIIQLQKVANG